MAVEKARRFRLQTAAGGGGGLASAKQQTPTGLIKNKKEDQI